MFITDKKWLGCTRAKYRAWQGIPTVERTNNGRLFVSFFTGETAEQIGNYAVIIKSDDNGKTWSEPIAAMYKEGINRCSDSQLWIDPLGRLWAFWALIPEPTTYAAICENPDADELVWGEEFTVAEGVMLNKPLVLSTGEWMFPIAKWHKNLVYASKKGQHGSFVYTSNDCGKTFKKLGAPFVRFPGYDESMVVERDDHSLMMMVRTTTGLDVAYSYDFGKNWTNSEETKIENPVTRFHIKKLKSGRVLFINNFSTGCRTNLTACLSEDDGKTWKYKLVLDTRDFVCYPDAVEDENGNIYIVYEHGRGVFKRSLEEIENMERQLNMAIITEEDIMAGELVNENSKLGTVISRLGKYEGDRETLYRVPFYTEESLKEQILLDMDDNTLFEEFVFPLCLFYDASAVNFETLREKVFEYRKCREQNVLDELIDTLKPVRTKGAHTIVHEGGETSSVDEWIFENTMDILRSENGTSYTLQEIGKKLDISPYYIERVFKQKTAISVEAYKEVLKNIKK